MLGLFGDSITTDHISPAGSIAVNSPAGRYLIENGVQPGDFNQYGTRRGNHEVMMRGTFANIRIKNLLLGGEEGPNTLHFELRTEDKGRKTAAEPSSVVRRPSSPEKLSFYDAAIKYRGRGCSADYHRRQGVRHRVEPRLGGERDGSPWRRGGPC